MEPALSWNFLSVCINKIAHWIPGSCTRASLQLFGLRLVQRHGLAGRALPGPGGAAQGEKSPCLTDTILAIRNNIIINLKPAHFPGKSWKKGYRDNRDCYINLKHSVGSGTKQFRLLHSFLTETTSEHFLLQVCEVELDEMLYLQLWEVCLETSSVFCVSPAEVLMTS